MVVVLDGVLDLLEGVLGVVHAEGDPVQQAARLYKGQRGVAQREAPVVVADAGRLLQREEGIGGSGLLLSFAKRDLR